PPHAPLRVDHAERAAARAAAANDVGDVLRDAAIGGKAGDRDRILGGAHPGDVDAHLRVPDGQRERETQRQEQSPHETPHEDQGRIIAIPKLQPRDHGVPAVGRSHPLHRSSFGPRAISSSGGQLPSLCRGSGDERRMPRSAASSHAAMPLERRSLTDMIVQSGDTATTKTAFGLPDRSAGAWYTVFERISDDSRATYPVSVPPPAPPTAPGVPVALPLRAPSAGEPADARKRST